MRICIVTDAWDPQVNGVVRTLKKLQNQIEEAGHEVRFITHENFKTVPLPTYPEIRLAIRPGKRISEVLNEFEPDAIHICTEGTLGLAARGWCIGRNHPYTASYHTRLPEYLNARTHFPVKWGYNLQRRFHQPAAAIMATTPTLCGELESRGFKETRLWSRGVDLDRFQIYDTDILDHLPRPIWTYVGRVAVEKNLEAFLDLNLEGTKVIVGDGPQMEELKAKYPDVHFAGTKRGEELAQHYAASDVFVFPSLTDTFGLVNLEALACGTPVAAYPVTGPKDIIGAAKVGCLDDDLEKACRGALGIATPDECRAHALKFSWAAGSQQFVDNLALVEHKPGYWEESRKFT
ncbi:MAG: glycosyltransferase family 1 protein [Alphaproteobacteria bacterium]|nr:MAG: glycosyltransferase family 1 protein [Alphaproteobacteria bacterium]